MASKTPKSYSRSPMKQKVQGGNFNATQSSQMALQDHTEFVVLDKDLIKGLNEKDVEIDHLKTTVVAL